MRVWSSGFRVSDVGCRVQSLGFGGLTILEEKKASGSGCLYIERKRERERATDRKVSAMGSRV